MNIPKFFLFCTLIFIFNAKTADSGDQKIRKELEVRSNYWVSKLQSRKLTSFIRIIDEIYDNHPILGGSIWYCYFEFKKELFKQEIVDELKKEFRYRRINKNDKKLLKDYIEYIVNERFKK